MPTSNPPDFGKYALTPTQHLLSFILVVIIVSAFGVYYFISVKKLKDNELPKGFAFLIYMYVEWIRNLTIDMLGKRYEKISWYFMYLILLLVLSNYIGIIGIDSLGTSFTVPSSLGLVTFFGSLYFGVKYQKWSYAQEFITWVSFRKVKLFFIPDPLKTASKFSPFISLIFRYWGNIFASSLLVGAFYEFVVGNLVGIKLNYVGASLGGFVIFFFHFYFDLLDGGIQPLIFTLLSFAYLASNGSLSYEELHYVPERYEKQRYISSYSMAMPDFI